MPSSKFFFVFFFLLSYSALAAVGSQQKLEGSCSGTLKDGTYLAFTYYSDFNGCRRVSRGVLVFTEGSEGLLTGSRSFVKNKDYYNFLGHDLTLLNATGNTSALFGYRDAQNRRHKVRLSCQIRDYHYEDCPSLKLK